MTRPRRHPEARGNGRGAASIEDVAAAALVSISTVSRVINNPGMVSSETAARVQAVIKQLGYVPNPFAKGLITRTSRVLGISLPDVHGDFYGELLRGANGEARRRRFHLLVSAEQGAEDAGPHAPPGGHLAFGLIDGLVLMITEPNEELWREAWALKLPVVVLDYEVQEEGVDCVLVDNTTGTTQATRHLLESTRASDLYFVGGPRENFDSQRRADTFSQALRQASCEPRGDQVSFGEYSVRWGFEWAKRFAQSRRGARAPAGVLAGNDEIALGVLQAAHEFSLRVPEDLRLVGFDDTRLASLVRPELSSVRVPMQEVGATAVGLLIKRLEQPDRLRETVRLSTTLVVRRSSAAK